MNFKNAVFLGFALFVVGFAHADETPEVDEHDKNIIPQSTAVHQSDFSLPNALSTIITNGGIVAGAVLALGALAVLFAPFFGLKLCTFFGNCDSTGYQAYSAAPTYNDYVGYQQGTYNNPAYQKRSLEYIGPILKALGNAYEKYGRQYAVSPTTSVKSA